jgi:hypothetical protein
MKKKTLLCVSEKNASATLIKPVAAIDFSSASEHARYPETLRVTIGGLDKNSEDS